MHPPDRAERLKLSGAAAAPDKERDHDNHGDKANIIEHEDLPEKRT